MTMKKVILSFIFGAVISVTSFTQQFINSFANQSGNWSSYYGDWVWKDIVDADISFLLQNNVIIANDIAKSTYTTLELFYDDGETFKWNAIDEEGRSCIVIMAVVNNYDCLLIVYDNSCFRYYY